MKVIAKEHPSLYPKAEHFAFLNIAPTDPEGWEKARKQIEGRSYARAELADVLSSYNRSIGNDAYALANIEKLKENGSVCVFTGQQLGFMSGPAYTILKGITCALMAKAHGAIPIFWLATEDHDVDEIDHAYLLSHLGDLKKYRLRLPKNGTFVEELRLVPEHREVIAAFLQTVGREHLLEEISQEETYCGMMARVMAILFVGTGLIFLEPRILRPFAQTFFLKELEECDRIFSILQNTTYRLKEAGAIPRLEFKEPTNLFLKVEGRFRRKIERRGHAYFVQKHAFNSEELFRLVEESPELFSTNAAARAVLQSILFPVAATVAGPAELAYHHQLLDYHRYHEVPMPWIVPRLSATMIPPLAQKWLNTCNLEPWNPLPHTWQEVFPDMEQGIPDLSQSWKTTAQVLLSDAMPSDVIFRKVDHYLHNLERRVIRGRLKREDIPSHALHYLHNLIHPHNRLQERVLNWFEFQSQSEKNLIQEMLQSVDWKTPGHLYCYT